MTRSRGRTKLLGRSFGVKLSKKYQRADWAERPLTDGMLEYAADDTRYLERLTELSQRGLCPADLVIEKWKGEWNERPERLVDGSSYRAAA